MANLITFVAGGGAIGGNLRNALDETLQEVVADGTKRTVTYGSFTNTGGSAATVKLFWSLPRWDLTFGGVIANGDYVVEIQERSTRRTIETATVTRAAGTPADEAALAVEMETEIESYIATTLAGLIVSADDDGVDGNMIVGARGVDLRFVCTAPTGATLEIEEVGPVLASAVPDAIVTIPAGAMATLYLGERPVSRLWMAATAESGAGATAPSADITGFIVL
jgi:hypothetical protein